MTELPKSVREQLERAQVGPDTHPDADLLTAYSENSLTDQERSLVADHIATCAECREIMFLAQPEPEQATSVVTAAPARRFRWMAWVSAAVVIVVIGSAVIIQREKLQTVEPPTAMATRTKPAEVKTDELAKKEHITAAPSANRLAARVQPALRSRENSAANQPSALPNTVPPATQASADKKKAKDETPQNAGLVANEAVQNSPVIAGKVSSGPANTQSANVTNVYTAQNTAPAAAPAATTARPSAGEARDAVASSSAFGYSQTETLRRELGRAHWRISKSGSIERSYLSDDWEPVLAGSGASFRIIAVVGNVVWAGGTHGALFVSRDGGTSWAPIKIDTSADITSIHFDDTANGKIQTSDGKSWKTSDGGTTWLVQ